MRLLGRLMAAVALALFIPAPLHAQTYPTQTPVYIPTAVLQPVTLTSTGYLYFTVQGENTVSVQFTGLSGTFTASVQGTNEAPSVANASATWTTLKMTPINGGSTVNSVSTASTWTVNASGLTRLRVNLSALSGSGYVTINMAGTNGGAVTYSAGSVVLTDVEAPVAPGTAPANSLLAGGVYNSAAPTFTNTQAGALQLTSAGQLIVSDASTEGVITAATSPTKMQVAGAVYTAAGVSLSTGQSVALQVNSTGQQIVTLPNLEAGLTAGTAPSKMAITGAQYNSGGVSLTTGQTVALQVNSTGQLITIDAASQGVITAATAPTSMQVGGLVYNSGGVSLTTGQSVALQGTSTGQLIVSDSSTEGVITAATAPTKMQLGGGVYNSGGVSLTNGQSVALQLDSDGSLAINLRDDTVVALDPCQSRNVAKSSVLANINSATTTSLVAYSGTKAVYVCGISVVAAATQTIYLSNSGASAACSGAGTALTPTYTAPITSFNAGFGGGTIITTPSTTGLCAVTSNTGATQVLVTYVQQ